MGGFAGLMLVALSSWVLPPWLWLKHLVLKFFYCKFTGTVKWLKLLLQLHPIFCLLLHFFYFYHSDNFSLLEWSIFNWYLACLYPIWLWLLSTAFLLLLRSIRFDLNTLLLIFHDSKSSLSRLATFDAKHATSHVKDAK